MLETDVFDSYLRCYSSTGSGAASLVLVWCPTIFAILNYTLLSLLMEVELSSWL
jgi:hypothetical protein